LALSQVRLHQREAPVEREPLRPAVRPQRGFLGGCRVECEPIRLHHRRGHSATTSAVAHRRPASARRRADRRPYRRAHIDVHDLGSSPAPARVMSRTRSSFTSSGFTTMIRRPVALLPGARHRTGQAGRGARPQSRAPGDRPRTFRSVARLPVTPDPTPVTESSVIPRLPASSSDPSGLAFHVSTPVSGRHPTVSNSPPAGLGGGFDHDRAGRELASRHRQGCGMEPVQGGPVRNPLTPRPHGQLQSPKGFVPSHSGARLT
jgi:hypothetical protein